MTAEPLNQLRRFPLLPADRRVGGGQVEENHAPALVELLSRRRFLWISIILSSLVLGTLAAAVTPIRHSATASMIVREKPPQIVDVAPVLAQDTGFLGLQSELENTMALIYSAVVVDPVMRRFNAIDDPEFNTELNPCKLCLADRIKGGLSWVTALVKPEKPAGPALAPVEETSEEEILWAKVRSQFLSQLETRTRGASRVIELTFMSDGAAKSAAIVNALANEYIAYTSRVQDQTGQMAIAELEKRVGDLRQKVTTSDQATERYRADARLLRNGDKDAVFEQLVDANTEHTKARKQVAEAGSRLSRIPVGPDGIANSPEAQQSEVIHALVLSQAQISQQLAERGAQFGNRSLEVLSLQAGLREVNAQIRTELGRIRGSLESELAGALQYQRSIEGIVTSLEQELARRNQAEVRLRELERETDANKDLLEVFLKRYQEISQQVGMNQPSAALVTPALEPDWSGGLRRPIIVFAGFGLLGLILAAAAVALAEVFSSGFHKMDHVESELRQPMLSLIPQMRNFGRSRELARLILRDPKSAFTESIRELSASLRMFVGTPNKIILFTSSVAHEGKTTVAISLARLSASSGRRVIILDCDLRRPRIHKMLKSGSEGLSDLLRGQSDLDEVIQVDDESGVHFITCGTRTNMPAELLGTMRMKLLLQELSRQYDLIILDTPPVMSAADARLLAMLADFVVYLVEWRKTPRKLVRLGLNRLAQSHNDRVGMVFTKVNAMSRSGVRYHLPAYSA
ncbi:capsular exopolysaccharide synthesis family protein [Skermanella aerolata]|uniref:GumC family protein n=1 Tax=Skermanella aerolata TaxID=393310 RepID=UPI003D247999